MRQLLRQLSAHRAIIGSALAFCLSIAIAYLVVTPPRYIAKATIFVDPPRLVLPGQTAVFADRPVDDSAIQSQIELLRSDEIVRRALEKLGLIERPEAIKADDATFQIDSLREAIKDVPALGRLLSKPNRTVTTEEAIDTLKNNLRIRRLGFAQVIEVSYISTDAKRAADVPNAVIEAYIEDQRQYLGEITRRSIEWMKNELSELKLKAEAAELAVEDIKAQGSDGSVARFRARLRELDANARSYRSMYDNLLLRYHELLQKEELPVYNARIVERATTPKGKSQPQVSLTLAFAAIIGLMIGVGCALMRDFFGGLRSAREVETALGVTALGVVPRIRGKPQAAPANTTAKVCASVAGPGRFMLDAPLSQHAETIRAARALIDRRRGRNDVRIIGVIAAFAGEGRSTLCTNLAQLLQASGASVLMIDADRYTRSLSRRLSTSDAPGLLNVFAGESTLSGAVWVDPVSGAKFLPVGRDGVSDDLTTRILSTSSIFASREMGVHITELAEGFDYVIVCLPPFSSSIDAVSAVDWVDSFLLVIEWDQTPPDVIATALARSGNFGGKVVGAILNKADPVYLKRTEGGRLESTQAPWKSVKRKC